jgi:hypothetical protein
MYSTINRRVLCKGSLFLVLLSIVCLRDFVLSNDIRRLLLAAANDIQRPSLSPQDNTTVAHIREPNLFTAVPDSELQHQEKNDATTSAPTRAPFRFVESIPLEQLYEYATGAVDASRSKEEHTTHAPTKAPFQYVPSSPQHQEVIDAYRRKVELAESQSRQCASFRNENRLTVDTSRALECLIRTTPNLELEYPDDAEEHFNEIRKVMAPWAQHSMHKMHRAAGYAGPWIENQWIAHFETLYDNEYNSTCLSHHFGPFIPIFLPWVDHWVNARFQYPEGFLDTLRSVLRPNVPYVTVSQNDEGLSGKNELDMRTIPNLLVLSAGGYGHVPIPLLKQPEMLNNYKNVTDRTIGISYVGSLKHAPRNMRRHLHERLLALDPSFKYEYFYGNTWRQVMADSRFSLAPRGYGRTAYHLIETLQMGLVPIHIYADTPWVPYAELFDEIGFVTDVDGVDKLIGKLNNMTADEIQERERRIVSLRTSHFSSEGAIAQIGRFLKGEGSDLRCQKLPSSIRGA